MGSTVARAPTLQWGRLAALAGLLAVGGCAHKRPTDAGTPTLPGATATDDDAVWPTLSSRYAELVPVQTPFVWLSEQPLPPAAVRRLAPALEAFVTFVDFELAQQHAQTNSETRQNMEAIFGGPPAIAALPKIGIDLNPRFVLYGLGLAPVVRIRLADREAFAAAVRRSQVQPGQETSIRDFHGQTYLSRDTGNGGRSIVALVGEDLVLAVLPPGPVQRELLPLVFGQRLPAQSLASTGTIANLRKRHRLRDGGGGYVDLERIVATVQGEATGLDARVADALNVGPDDAGSAVCADETRALVRHLPRLVGGMMQGPDDRFVWTLRLETSAEVGRALQPLANPIPAIPTHDHAVAYGGLGVNLAGLRDAVAAWDVAWTRAPLKCPTYVDLNAVVHDAAESLATLPAETAAIQSMAVSLLDFDTTGGETSGLFVANVDDPKALVAVLGQTPNLRVTALLRDHVAPLSALLAPGTPLPEGLQRGWVAYGEHSIGLGVGTVGRDTVVAALDRDLPHDGALAVMTLDTATWLSRAPHRLEKLLRLRGRLHEQAVHALIELFSATEVRLHTSELGVGIQLQVPPSARQ